jgi:hypothetical protein
MKTKNAIMGISLALSLGVASLANAAPVARVAEMAKTKFSSFEKFREKNGKDLEAVAANKDLMEAIKPSEAARRVKTTLEEASKIAGGKDLNGYATMVIKGKRGKGIDAIEAMTAIDQAIRDLGNKADAAEVQSFRTTLDAVSEFMFLIGTYGQLAPRNNEHIRDSINFEPNRDVSFKAAEKLLEILPDVMTKFETTRREAYTQFLGEVNKLLQQGYTPAEALFKILGKDKLQKLIECTL